MYCWRLPGSFACVIFLVLLGLAAHADDWSLTPEVKNTPYQFGETRVVLHYDSMTNRQYPEYTLKVFRGKTLQAEHKGVGFEQVFAEKENRFFVGLSNRGLTRTAWVVFDQEGRIIREQRHDIVAMKYCRSSITVVREWYDKEKPEVRFKVEGGKLKEVSVRDCQGKRLLLLEVIGKG
jgi:hypothetical protein